MIVRTSWSGGVAPPLLAGVITLRVRCSVRCCELPLHVVQSPVVVHADQSETWASMGAPGP
jgi:hypothetical protein